MMHLRVSNLRPHLNATQRAAWAPALALVALASLTACGGGHASSGTEVGAQSTGAPDITYTGFPASFIAGSPIDPQAVVNRGGAITSCVVTPALPAGLELSELCEISGTPSSATPQAEYTVQAANAQGSSSATIGIAVTDAALAISFSGSAYVFTKGTPITPETPSSTGAITGCSVNPPLPSGLNLSASDCSLSGTPSVAIAAATYTITATGSVGSASTTIDITVNDVAPGIGYGGSPFIFTDGVAITTITPTNTGGAVTSCSASPALPTGLSLSSGCSITGTPTGALGPATYTITAVNSGGSATASISIAVNEAPPAIAYTGGPFTYAKGTAITKLSASNSGGSITSCSVSPALPAGLTFSSSDCSISGTPTAVAAQASYTVTATNATGSSSATISITVSDVAPAIAYSGSPYSWTKGAAIATETPANTGGAIVSCSVSPSLPPGLALSGTDCSISGTPASASATASYTVTANNVSGSSSATIEITIDDSPPVLSFSPGAQVFTLRTAISTITPSNGGGTVTSCSATPALPVGLTLSSGCVITGTPTAVSSNASYTITGTNSGGSSSATLAIRVKDLPEILFYGLSSLSGGANGTAPGSTNVWKATVDGVDRIALTQNSNASLDSSYPSFSRDGSKVVYASKRALSGAPNGTASVSANIWSSSANGLSPVALSSNGTVSGLDSDEPPRFSPDGTKIAFASKMALSGSPNGTPTGSYNIWIMNADGTGKVHLTANTSAGLDSHTPVFSPDGQTIYFSSKTALNGTDNGTAADYNIWKVGVNGSGKTALTTSSASRDSTQPQVSPDGTKIAFTSKLNVSGNTKSLNIWIVNNDGTGLTYLTGNTAMNQDSQDPQFSPDGTEIVFSSLMKVSGVATASYNIWKMAAGGTSQAALTTNTGSALDSRTPVFSPDNLKVVFSSKMAVGGTAASSYNIWVINSDGTGTAVSLTSNTSAGLDSYLAPGGVWFTEQ